MSGQPVVLVLASGRGERFLASGGTMSKLQAPLAGRSVLEWTLAAVRASGLPYHVENAGHAGMGDSIASAVRTTSAAPGWLILPGDLPLIHAATLLCLAAMPADRAVVVPVFEGRRGHPVRFSSRCGSDLMHLRGDQGASRVARSWGATEWVVHDAGCVTDIDTLDDLHRAERILADFDLAQISSRLGATLNACKDTLERGDGDELGGIVANLGPSVNAGFREQVQNHHARNDECHAQHPRQVNPLAMKDKAGDADEHNAQA